MKNRKNRKFCKKHKIVVWLAGLFLPVRKSRNLLIQDGQNILIVYPRRIGDCVMAIPFLKHIRAQHDVNLTIAGPGYFRDILNGQNLYDEFVDFGACAGPLSGNEWLRHRKEIALARKKINRKKYDIAIEPFGECFASVFMRMCRARYYAGMNIGSLHRLYSISAVYDDDRHITDNMLNLYQQLGGVRDEALAFPSIYPSDSWKKLEKRIADAKNLNAFTVIGIHCGASTKQKQWTGYAELARLCTEGIKDAFFILYADKDNMQGIRKIISQPQMHGRYLVIRKGLREYTDCLRLCHVVICNDSSCGHLCAAQGINTVVIYGPYLPVMGTPRGNCSTSLISKDLSCKPCSYFSCKYGSDYRCLKAVRPKEVYQEAVRLLKEPGRLQTAE